MRASWIAVVVTSLLWACGDDGGGDPAVDGAPTIDAVATPDATDNCEFLCTCLVGVCGEAEDPSCVADCRELAPSVQSCRAQHCQFATGNATLHCPHAMGDTDPGAGTPAECLAQ